MKQINRVLYDLERKSATAPKGALLSRGRGELA